MEAKEGGKGLDLITHGICIFETEYLILKFKLINHSVHGFGTHSLKNIYLKGIVFHFSLF